MNILGVCWTSLGLMYRMGIFFLVGGGGVLKFQIFFFGMPDILGG